MKKLFYKKIKPTKRLIAILFLVSLAIVIVVGCVGIPMMRAHRYFPAAELNLETYDLFDLGVADVNADGAIDVFTSNHSARQSVALNDGNGVFEEALTQLGLDQDAEFPGLEDSLRSPTLSKPGLYLYRKNRSLYLQSHLIKQAISGQVQLSWPIEVENQLNGEASVNTQTLPLGEKQSVLKFTLQPDGFVALKGKEDIVELAHTVSIEATLSPEQIFIGLENTQPSRLEFDLMWRDRHSFAWADINQDQKMDAFIVRGGVKGQLENVADTVSDEMMLMSGTRFDDQATQLGFEKKGCPGRQAAWVDFNQDNRLDLYIGCGRAQEPSHPNQLYQQQPDGRFLEVAARLGLDFSEDGVFRWLDVDNDGDVDLLVVRDQSIWLYSQTAGKFAARKIENRIGDQTRNQIEKDFPFKILGLLPADFDADGDLDIYVESKQAEDANLLLINHHDQIDAAAGSLYTVQSPSRLGLPSTGVGASWVDYDNDGFRDFYIAPHGLYRQQPNHQFESTRLFRWQSWYGPKIVGARTAWVDVDNDGDRDLVTTTKQTPSLPVRLLSYLPKVEVGSHWQKVWQSKLYRNQTQNNHWLELTLFDPTGNSQAIGAKVTLQLGDVQQAQTVGEAESAYFSQGHYRLYFGLGKYRKVDAIRIVWPDGQTQQLGEIKANQLLQIEKSYQ